MINQIRLPVRGSGVKLIHWNCHITNIERLCYLAGVPVAHVQNSGDTDPTVNHKSGKDRYVWTTPGGAPNLFSIEVNKHQVVIDFSDLMREGIAESDFKKYPVVFKYHYYPICDSYDNVYPLCSALDISSLNVCRSFFALCHSKIYSCNSDIILNNQRPHTRALERRTYVQTMLKNKYGDLADISFEMNNQHDFWNKFKNCLASVVVPGACNFMVDRGHLEQLALGVCTICPKLIETFPYEKKLEAWKHYVPCRDDYSDLCNKVEWCKKHRDKCREIGDNAYNFYWSFLSPRRQLEWIEKVLRTGYLGD